jgi:acyl dehydratase
VPFPTSIVGVATEPVTLTVDVRATMAYAAGIGDLNPAYLDTTRAGGVVAHPLFPVRPEWPAVLAAGPLIPPVLSRAEAKASLHLTHDLTIHRLIRPGDELTTTATFDRVARHRAGALAVLRLETTDQHAAAVCTTEFGSVYRGTEVLEDGPPAVAFDLGDATVPGAGAVETMRSIGAGAAHVYTECAQIWNPIHTDPVVAHAAGLADIVLHGTATLAMAVSEVVDRWAGGDPSRVRRIRARFGATVGLPSSIRITSGPLEDRGDHDAVSFVVTNDEGAPAIRGGSVLLAPAS